MLFSVIVIFALLLATGVALLPFVDERRLRAALAEVYSDLTPDEGKAYTFIANKQYITECLNEVKQKFKIIFCFEVVL